MGCMHISCDTVESVYSTQCHCHVPTIYRDVTEECALAVARSRLTLLTLTAVCTMASLKYSTMNDSRNSTWTFHDLQRDRHTQLI